MKLAIAQLDLGLDFELFVVVGANWTIPVYVRWANDRKTKEIYGVISPAVGLYHTQELILNALFEDHDIQGLTSEWIVPRDFVVERLQKATGSNPRVYYQDDPSRPYIAAGSPFDKHKKRQDSIAIAPPKPDRDHGTDFVKFVSQQYAIPASVVKAVTVAIAEAGPKWMIEFRRPIDFGFCKLFAAPLRVNWKQIVAHKFREYPMLNYLKRPNWRELMRDLAMPEALCSPQNMGLKTSGSVAIDYSIEVIPSKRFEATVTTIGQRRHEAGTTIKDFESTIESMYELLCKALETYLRKIRQPFAKVHQGSFHGQPRLLPTRGDAGEVPGVGLGKLPVYIIPPASGFSVQAESRVENVVLPKVKIVSKMLDSRPEDGHVRKCEESGTVDRSSDGEAEADRVPL